MRAVPDFPAPTPPRRPVGPVRPTGPGPRPPEPAEPVGRDREDAGPATGAYDPFAFDDEDDGAGGDLLSDGRRGPAGSGGREPRPAGPAPGPGRPGPFPDAGAEPVRYRRGAPAGNGGDLRPLRPQGPAPSGGRRRAPERPGPAPDPWARPGASTRVPPQAFVDGPTEFTGVSRHRGPGPEGGSSRSRAPAGPGVLDAAADVVPGQGAAADVRPARAPATDGPGPAGGTVLDGDPDVDAPDGLRDADPDAVDPLDLDPDDADDLDPDDLDDAPVRPAQAWAGVAAQWLAGAVAGAVLWVLFRYLWRGLPVVALAASGLATTGLVLLVRQLLHDVDRRTTAFAVLVGLLLTASPAVLVLLGK